MKILVTGATGLLGSDVVYTMREAGYDVIKTSTSAEGNDAIRSDLTTDKGIDAIAGSDWDFLIHTAASKDPDWCEEHKDDAFRINVLASVNLSQLARERKAGMIFVSTDYVFEGKNPPYSESDPIMPINYYGNTKVKAEDMIKAVLEEVCILRVPVLYGAKAGLKASSLIHAAFNALNSDKKCLIDDVCIRYPTSTADVAGTILTLIQNRAAGIFHYSGLNKMTKYSITLEIGRILGKDTSHISRLDELDTIARRPLDSHLSMEKIIAIGAKLPVSFEEGARTVLKELSLL
jgi:dTDP-4-dehydrorhamnose reductase